MSALELDETGDILIENGNVSIISGIDAIRQHLQNRLRTFRGEWFLDRELGIPFFDEITKKNPDISILNAIFSNTILETEGVVSLDDLVFNINNGTRELLVQFSATTASGTITETLTFGG